MRRIDIPRPKISWFIGIIIFLFALGMMMPEEAVSETGEGRPITLATAMAKTRHSSGYVPVSVEQERRAAGLFERLLRGEKDPNIAAGLGKLGLVLGQVRIGDELLTLIREAPGHAEGKGVYVFRAAGAPVLLQVPHRFTDLGTGEIAAAMLKESTFRAAAWNTVPRSYGGPDGTRVDADLAHIETSIFNAFGIAFARSVPKGRVAQIHGFARGSRETFAGQAAGVIVSAGIETPSPSAREVARCMAAALKPEPARLFSEEVRELGGTTNSNGKTLRAIGFEGFVHLELSREVRSRLLDDATFRGRFTRCVLPSG